MNHEYFDPHSDERWFDDLLRQSALSSAGEERLLADARQRLSHALASERRERAALDLIPSPLGRLVAIVSVRGIALLQYLDTEPRSRLETMLSQARQIFDLVHDTEMIAPVRIALERYFEGNAASLDHPVDLRLVRGEFRKKILTRLLQVSPGVTISYGALGAWAGAPNSPRAVGNAMNTNPIAIYVPCHRVVTSDGGLGGYAGGLDAKRRLLRLEGFELGSKGRLTDTALVGHRRTRIFCRPGCRAVARADRRQMLLFCGTGQAEQAGMRPCKLCRPTNPATQS